MPLDPTIIQAILSQINPQQQQQGLVNPPGKGFDPSRVQMGNLPPDLMRSYVNAVQRNVFEPIQPTVSKGLDSAFSSIGPMISRILASGYGSK